MKKVAAYIMVVGFTLLLSNCSFGEDAAGQKGDVKQGADTKQEAQGQAPGNVPSVTAPPPPPEVVIPKPIIPRIVFGQEGAASQTPAAPQASGEGKSPQASGGQAQAHVMPANFGSSTGQLVSISEKDANNLKIKIKTDEGEELDIVVPSYMTVTKNIAVKDIKAGEKLGIHYIVDMANKTNTALYITTGELERFKIPPVNMPIKPTERPREGVEKK